MSIKNKINFFSNEYSVSEDIINTELDFVILDIKKRIRLDDDPSKWSLIERMLVKTKLALKLKESCKLFNEVPRKKIYLNW